MDIEKQKMIINEFPIIYEKISQTYHEDRFSDKWGVYDYTETNILIPELLSELKMNITGLEILDVGCGTGKVSIPLALMDANVNCLDASTGMLAQCYERAVKQGCEKRITLIKASADYIPKNQDSYDLVISTRFLHLFPIQMYPLFIAEMLRVTKPNGYVIIEIKNRFYGGFINIRNELIKKVKGGTPSSSMTIFEMKKLVENLGILVCMKGCLLPKGQIFCANSNISGLLRKLSRKTLRAVTLSSYVVIKKR